MGGREGVPCPCVRAWCSLRASGGGRMPFPPGMRTIRPVINVLSVSALLALAGVPEFAPGQSLSSWSNEKGEVDFVSYSGDSEWLVAQEDPRSHLHKLPALDTVALNNHRVSREAMSYLCGLKGLKYLELGTAPEGILVDHEALAELAKARGLEELTLTKSGLRDEDFAFLPALKNLAYLEVAGGWFTNEWPDRLTGAAANFIVQSAGLEELRVTQIMGPVPDSFVAGLGAHPGLKGVEIRTGGWSHREDVEYFSDVGVAGLARCRTLDLVQLGSPKLTRASLHSLLALPELLTLSLSIRDLEAADFTAIRVKETLESLSLPKAAPTDEQFAELSGHPALTTLILDGQKLTLQSRVVLESLPKLERVRLPGAPPGLLRKGEWLFRWENEPKDTERLPPGVTPRQDEEELLPPGVERG